MPSHTAECAICPGKLQKGKLAFRGLAFHWKEPGLEYEKGSNVFFSYRSMVSLTWTACLIKSLFFWKSRKSVHTRGRDILHLTQPWLQQICVVQSLKVSWFTNETLNLQQCKSFHISGLGRLWLIPCFFGAYFFICTFFLKQCVFTDLETTVYLHCSHIIYTQSFSMQICSLCYIFFMFGLYLTKYTL